MKTLSNFWNKTLSYGVRTLVRTIVVIAVVTVTLMLVSETAVSIFTLALFIWGYAACIAFFVGLLEEVTEKPLLSREYGIPYNTAG